MNRTVHALFVATALAGDLGATVAFSQHDSFDEDGAAIYESACAECHGENGDSIAGIDLGRGRFRRPYTDRELAGLISALTRQSAIGVIAAGRNTMPAFRASYSDQELRDLAAYVAERLAAVNN